MIALGVVLDGPVIADNYGVVVRAADDNDGVVVSPACGKPEFAHLAAHERPQFPDAQGRFDGLSAGLSDLAAPMRSAKARTVDGDGYVPRRSGTIVFALSRADDHQGPCLPGIFASLCEPLKTTSVVCQRSHLPCIVNDGRSRGVG